MMFAMLLHAFVTTDVSDTSGVWTVAGVVESRPAPNVRVFSLPIEGRYRVVVVDGASNNSLMRAAAQQIRACTDGDWYPIGSYDRAAGGKSAALSCMTPRPMADAMLSVFNSDPLLTSAMQLGFNVSEPCAHRENKIVRALGGKWWRTLLFPVHRYFRDVRAWAIAIDENMVPDVFHSDGHEFLVREPGDDFITALVYPSAEEAARPLSDEFTIDDEGSARWDDSWGGRLQVAAAVVTFGSKQQMLSEQLSTLKESSAIEIAPRPGRAVIFSGMLMHRSSPPTELRPPTPTMTSLLGAEKRAGGRPVPPESRWRLTSVMQLTCHNNAYHGPYEPDDSPNVGARLLGALLLIAFGISQGHLPNPFKRQGEQAAERLPVRQEKTPRRDTAAATATAPGTKASRKKMRGRQ